MKVTRAFMVALRAHARDMCGGYKHALEVQTWDRGNGMEIDIADFSEEDCDNSDVGGFYLAEGQELPDNAEQIDIQVFGVDFKGGGEADMTKLGYFYISIKDGELTNETWQ